MGTAFKTGKLYTTEGIHRTMSTDQKFEREVNEALQRYLKCDWSDMEYEEDKQLNEAAVQSGGDRIFATYNTSKGKIYIITEIDRTATTILFPSEY